MDEKLKRKIRLERLLEKQKRKLKEDYSALFYECVESLGDGTIILSKEESKNIYERFQMEYPITFYGRIDWDSVRHRIITIDELPDLINDYSKEFNVLWSHGSNPIIKTNLNKLLKNFKDVYSVSPDVWIYSENEYVVEFFHDGIFRINFQEY